MTERYYNNYEETRSFGFESVTVTLASGSNVTYTVPGNATNNYIAEFEYNANNDIFVGYNTSAAVPSSNTANSSSVVEYKPKKRYVKGGDTLNFVTPNTTVYFGFIVRTIPS